MEFGDDLTFDWHDSAPFVVFDPDFDWQREPACKNATYDVKSMDGEIIVLPEAGEESL